MQLDKITAGDSLNFLVAGGAYPASAGWVLTYLLVPRAAGPQVTITAVAEGDDHRVAVASATTENYAAGTYTWFRRVEKTGERYTLDQGQLVVSPNPTSLGAAGFDGRSMARKALEDLKAARASWIATNGRVASYTIAGRQMTYRSGAEIDREIAYWEQQVASEEMAERIAQGLRPRNRIVTRFVRPR